MTTTVWVKLEFTGPDAESAAGEVDTVLDFGGFQDEILEACEDADMDVAIEAATVTDPPDEWDTCSYCEGTQTSGHKDSCTNPRKTP